MYMLVSGTKYAIVVKSTDYANAWVTYRRGSTYAGGALYYYNVSWVYEGHDANFKIHLDDDEGNPVTHEYYWGQTGYTSFSYESAMTFTAASDHGMDAISLRWTRWSKDCPSDELTIEIQATTDGKPNGTVLMTVTIPYNDIPTGTPTWHYIEFEAIGVTTEAASEVGINHAKGNGTVTGESITERGFEVRLAFSGTLREAINHGIAGFEGSFTYNTGIGKWEGTLIKTASEEGTFVAESFVDDLGRFPIAIFSDRLFAGETYNYRARATIGGTMYYGDWVEFTTAGYPSGEGPDEDAVSPEEPIIEPIPPEVPEIIIPPWEWPEIDIPPFEFDPSIVFGKTFGAFLRGMDTKKDWETLREKCIIYQENMNEFVLATNHNNLVIKNLVIDIISYIDGDVYPSALELVESSQQLTPLYLEEISPSGFKDIINDFRLKDVCNVHTLNLNFKKILNSLNSLYESDYVTEPISYNAIEYIDIQPTAKRMILQLEDMRKKYREVRRLTLRNMKRIFTYV